MATIKPFQCIRPEKSVAHRVAALPYDVYNRQEAKAEVQREPLSFLKIDRAETGFFRFSITGGKRAVGFRTLAAGRQRAYVSLL